MKLFAKYCLQYKYKVLHQHHLYKILQEFQSLFCLLECLVYTQYHLLQ